MTDIGASVALRGAILSGVPELGRRTAGHAPLCKRTPKAVSRVALSRGEACSCERDLQTQIAKLFALFRRQCHVLALHALQLGAAGLSSFQLLAQQGGVRRVDVRLWLIGHAKYARWRISSRFLSACRSAGPTCGARRGRAWRTRRSALRAASHPSGSGSSSPRSPAMLSCASAMSARIFSIPARCSFVFFSSAVSSPRRSGDRV